MLDDALDGALLGLSLPAAESRAVIVQNELHVALRHCTKPTGAGGEVKKTKVSQTIDILRRTGSHCVATDAAPDPRFTRPVAQRRHGCRGRVDRARGVPRGAGSIRPARLGTV